jgi:acyl-CoA synthetase (AMP-forming)/AMP-acid ligase II
LYALPEVAEAAVIGMPDDVLGQSIRAVLTLRKGAQLTEKDVLRHCATRLENFMVPQSVVFMASLPKTGTGKINKRLVAAAQTGAEPA